MKKGKTHVSTHLSKRRSEGGSDVTMKLPYSITGFFKRKFKLQKWTASNLKNAELEKLKYWNPEVVGEIIFNYWD